MNLSKRKLSPYFLLALLLLLGWISFQVIGVFLNYLVSGLFIAYLAYPGYRWLHKRVRYAPAAALLMLIGITAMVLVPLFFIILELVQELADLLFVLSDPRTLEAWITQMQIGFYEFVGRDPETIDPETRDTLVQSILPIAQSAISRMGTLIIQQLPAALIGVFVMLYIMYYAFVDGHKFIDIIRDILPMQEAHRDLMFHEIGNVIRAVMFGQVLTSLIQAVLAGIGYAVFGVPNAILWSVVTFVLALLPVIGPPLVWAPWGLVLIAQGDTFAGVGLIIYSAIMVSSIDNIIRPKLIGDRAHIHPTVVLLGVLGGVVVFGFAGIIMGPLVLSVFVTILNVYRKEFAIKMEDDIGEKFRISGD